MADEPRRRLTTFAVVVLAAAFAVSGAAVGARADGVEPDPAAAASARDGARYLAGRQGDNGSVPAGWRADQAAETVVALVAGGGEEGAVARALDFIAANGPGASSSGPFTGRIVSGLVAAGQDPRSFGGMDYVARLESFHVAGSYGGQGVYADTLAMLGLLAAGRPLPDEVITRLVVNQCADGGWSHREGCLDDPDTDTTALAVSVLAAARGEAAEEVREGRAWLLNTQGSSGCWGLQAGDAAQANSCGLALSAVAGLGEDRDAPPWTEGTRRPSAALRDLQLPSGGFKSRADRAIADDYATVQAVPGVAGWSYPVSPPPPPDPPATATTVPREEPSAAAPSGGPPGAGAVRGDAGGDRNSRAEAASGASEPGAPAQMSPPPEGDRVGWIPRRLAPTVSNGADPDPDRGPKSAGPIGSAVAWLVPDDAGLPAAATGAAVSSLAAVGVGLGWQRRRR